MPLVSLENTITIAISVRDRHASAKWYGEKLGFDVLYHADEAGWSELKTMTDGVTLGLGEQAEANPGNAVPELGSSELQPRLRPAMLKQLNRRPRKNQAVWTRKRDRRFGGGKLRRSSAL